MLEVPALAFRGASLGVGGTLPVPCPWCNPRPWLDRPWTLPLLESLDRLTK